MVQPHVLLPWLLDRGLFPNISKVETEKYWDHLSQVGSPLANASRSKTHIPLWLWGDAANYINDENLMVFCVGHVLDDQKNSIKKCFPIVVCREDPCLYRSCSCDCS